MSAVTITFDEGTRMAIQAAYLVGRIDQKTGQVADQESVVVKVATFLREAAKQPDDAAKSDNAD